MKLCYALLLCGVNLYADPFVNLDFEMANITRAVFQTRVSPNPLCPFNGPVLYGTGKASDFLPGWTIAAGSNQVAFASFGFGFAETNLAGIRHAGILGDVERRFPDPCTAGKIPIQGKYALVIDNSAQFGSNDLTNVPVAVYQRGDIPIDVDTLTLTALNPLLLGFLGITIDGNYLTPRDVCCDFSQWQVDISKWAGKTVNLVVSGLGVTVIDDIKFERLNPQAQILDWALTTNQFTCSWRASTYQVQPEVATNVPPVWQPLDARIITTAGTSRFTESFSQTNQITSQRFYRLRTLP